MSGLHSGTLRALDLPGKYVVSESLRWHTTVGIVKINKFDIGSSGFIYSLLKEERQDGTVGQALRSAANL